MVSSLFCLGVATFKDIGSHFFTQNSLYYPLRQKQLTSLLKECVTQPVSSSKKSENIWANIRGFGTRLFEDYIPDEIKKKLLELKTNTATNGDFNGSIISISSNDDSIPWELFYDGRDFWAQNFIISRLPRFTQKAKITEEDIPPELLTSHEKKPKVVNVIGGDIPENYKTKAKASFNTYEKVLNLELLEKTTAVTVLDVALDTDILHFTCHGFIDDTGVFRLQLGDYPSITQDLSAWILQEKSRKLKGTTIVFANACSAAQEFLLLDQSHNFAWDFYRMGAIDYIGALAPIPTEFAISFARLFYDRLFEGKTVGEALYFARQTFTMPNSKTNIPNNTQNNVDNPLWLLYSLWGSPFTTKKLF